MGAEIIHDDVLIALKSLEDRGENFDCVVMDPPYCSGGLMPAQITRGSFGKYIKATDFEEFNDGMSSLVYYRFMIEVFTRCLRVLNKPGYIFTFIDWRMYPVIYEALERGGGRVLGAICWNKNNAIPHPGMFQQSFELILYATNGRDKTTKHGGMGVIDCPAPLSAQRIHPTQKPVAVYSRLYKIIGGRRVLELFSGSASGGVAAIQNGLDYVGVESSPFYVAASRKRLHDEMLKMDFLQVNTDKDNKPGAIQLQFSDVLPIAETAK